MWSAIFSNRTLRLTAKAVFGILLVATLFIMSATEVEFVYTGF